jgi:hypothetical protein
VLAALTHDAALRPTPSELLAHPWVMSYVRSVTNLLSQHSFSSAEELAVEVVKVTGSSETAVSMLRSIGSLQVCVQAFLQQDEFNSGHCSLYFSQAVYPSVLNVVPPELEDGASRRSRQFGFFCGN